MSDEMNNVNSVEPKDNEVVTDNASQYAKFNKKNKNDKKVLNVNAKGVVSNCKKLNIRREAKKETGNVLCTVSADDVLAIDKNKSTDMWFYVNTKSGVSGYCMKEFVTLNE